MISKTKHHTVRRGYLLALGLFVLAFATLGSGLLVKNSATSPSAYASAQYPADLNNDGVVNISDLSILITKWSTTDTTADVNSDGAVNIFDLSFVISRWGNAGGGAALPSNVARSATPTVTASSQDTGAGQGAENAVDGSLLGYPVDDTGEWSTTGGRAGSWLQLTWSSPVNVNKIILYDRPNADDQITGGTLVFSDGTTVPVTSLNNDGSAVTINFSTRSITSVRLNITSVSAATQNIGLAEIEVWGSVNGAVNHAPVANAGADQAVYTGYATTLNGSGSSDPDANVLTYAWSKTSGPAVSLSSSTAASPTFTPTTAGTYVFSLTVSDSVLTSSPDTVTITVSTAPAGTLTAADLQLINTKRIVFGHQSVGGNIMGGIGSVYDSLGVTLPNETTTRTAPASGAYFMDFYVGSNGDPTGKTNDFNTVIRAGTGSRADVAFFKFCYVDVGAGTNITTLFNSYRSTMDALATSYPNVKFIYVTQPLTAGDAADNLQREQYNTLVRNTYGGTGRVFDLAKVESTQPNGQRVSGTLNSQTYYSLYSGYTSDGGHLNSAGSTAAAKELLTVIANQLK